MGRYGVLFYTEIIMLESCVLDRSCLSWF